MHDRVDILGLLSLDIYPLSMGVVERVHDIAPRIHESDLGKVSNDLSWVRNARIVPAIGSGCVPMIVVVLDA